MSALLEFDYKKATQAINYLAEREGGHIDKLKLIKLVYLADRYHLRRYGRPLMNDVYFAMPYGPVGSSVKDIAEFSDYLDEAEYDYAKRYLGKGKVPNTVVSNSAVDTGVFSKSELEALSFAFDTFGTRSASDLIKLTHRYPEWNKFENTLNLKETTREKMSYLDFFDNPRNADTDAFALDEEVVATSREAFAEHNQLTELWK